MLRKGLKVRDQTHTSHYHVVSGLYNTKWYFYYEWHWLMIVFFFLFWPCTLLYNDLRKEKYLVQNGSEVCNPPLTQKKKKGRTRTEQICPKHHLQLYMTAVPKKVINAKNMRAYDDVLVNYINKPVNWTPENICLYREKSGLFRATLCLIFASNRDCSYLLEQLSHHSEHPKSMFWAGKQKDQIFSYKNTFHGAMEDDLIFFR